MKKKTRASLTDIARDILSCPTAQFREHRVREHILAFCRTRNIRTTVDAFGNVLAEYGTAFAKKPGICFSAHMDHPGFIVESVRGKNRVTAVTYGDFPCDPLTPRRVRIAGDKRETVGTIRRIVRDKVNRIKRLVIDTDGAAFPGYGMWDIPAYRLRDGIIYSRGCDDVIGCAAMLAMFDSLARERVRARVLGAFTVAEEGGCHGAKYLCMNKGIPRGTPVISIETSKALSNAPIGGGAVIRVGDKKSIFDPAVTKFLVDTAAGLSSQKTFRYQRRLMDGGTCEGTVYTDFYPTGAVCIPLGNYHNRNADKNRIDAEYVSTADLGMLVDLLAASARSSRDIAAYRRRKAPRYRMRRDVLGERCIG